LVIVAASRASRAVSVPQTYATTAPSRVATMKNSRASVARARSVAADAASSAG